MNETQYFKVPVDRKPDVKEVMNIVYNALIEKGYDPKSQIVGYILSGDPTYITSYQSARSIITKIERDELLEKLLENYIETNYGK